VLFTSILERRPSDEEKNNSNNICPDTGDDSVDCHPLSAKNNKITVDSV
jgi:hypothetical protein